MDFVILITKIYNEYFSYFRFNFVRIRHFVSKQKHRGVINGGRGRG